MNTVKSLGLIAWLLQNGHAKAQRHAEHIVALLSLGAMYERGEYEAIEALVSLYRWWRKDKELTRAECVDLARSGHEPGEFEARQISMELE